MSSTQLSIPRWDDPAFHCLRQKWGWVLAMGVFMILGGIFAISFPLAASVGVALFVGWILLISGILRCIHIFMAKDWSGGMFELLFGLLQAIGGGLILGNVFAGLAAITMILAISILIGGIMRVIVAFQIKPAQGWGWMLFGGVVGILLAMVLFSNFIEASLVMIGTILGIYLLFDGWAAVALALVAKRARRELDHAASTGAGS